MLQIGGKGDGPCENHNLVCENLTSSLSGFDYLKSQDSRFWNFENLVLGSRGFYFGAVGLVWVNEAGNFLLYAAWSLAPRMWRRLRL